MESTYKGAYDSHHEFLASRYALQDASFRGGMNSRNGRQSRFVLKYYLYQATVTFGLIWPILVLFLRIQNISFT